MSLEERIRKVLDEKVSPILESHLGGVVLTKVENKIAYVRLTGACGSCPSAQFTIEDIVRGAVLEEVPELEDLVLDTSVSDELMDMARKILNKGK